MHLAFAAFTRRAGHHAENEDRVLVQDLVLEDGVSDEGESGSCRAFVADGVGGRPAGQLASAHLLRMVAERLRPDAKLSREEIGLELAVMNRELIDAHNTPMQRGLATTLAGVLVGEAGLVTVSVGDSEVWVSRGGRLFSITEPQTVGRLPGAPLESYFGGEGCELCVNFDNTLDEMQPGDVVLVCSDGLFKAVTTAEARAALSSPGRILDRTMALLRSAERSGLPDDTSCALIEVLEA